jgi:hypothetical protein
VDFPGILHTSKEALSVIQHAAIIPHNIRFIETFLVSSFTKDIQANATGGNFIQKGLFSLFSFVFSWSASIAMFIFDEMAQ